MDSDGDALDSNNLNCATLYNLFATNELSTHCGVYDDDDFSANEMCCVCAAALSNEAEEGGKVFYDISVS